MFPWNFFPFNKDTKKMMQQMKPEQIEKYVQEMMEKMYPQQMQGPSNPQEFLKGFNPFNQTSPQAGKTHASLESSVFETHDFVYIKIPIKENKWLKEMKLFHTSNQLIVEHIPEYENKHTITLPAIVKKKGTTAQLKDDILEVKLPKNIDMQYSEIDVQERL